jgi:hypothetical protein
MKVEILTFSNDNLPETNHKPDPWVFLRKIIWEETIQERVKQLDKRNESGESGESASCTESSGANSLHSFRRMIVRSFDSSMHRTFV